MRQMNFENKVAEVSRKPSSAISLEDAEEIQATEVWESPCRVQHSVKSLTRGSHRDVHLTNLPESATYLPRFGLSLTVTMRWDLQLQLMCPHISPRMMPETHNMPKPLFMAVRTLGEEWQLRCR